MSRIRGRSGAFIMAALLGLYLVASVILGVGYLSSGQPVAIAMGVAMLVLPLIGGWALWIELRFGLRSEKLVTALATDGSLPELPPTPSAFEYRAHAQSLLPEVTRATETGSAGWKEWMRLGIVLDAAGKRKEARAAVRTAIKLAY